MKKMTTGPNFQIFGFTQLWRILLCLLLPIVACEKIAKTPQSPRSIPLNEVVIHYLSISDYINPDFASQTIGSIFRFEHADFRNRMLYFSTPLKTSFQTFGQICIDTTSLSYSKPVNGVSHLPPGQLRDSTRFLLRFPFESLSVDSSLSIHALLGSYTYSLSLHELRDLHLSKTLYNSPALALWKSAPTTPSKIANHSAPIAKEGEPTLEKLVSQIIPDTTLNQAAKAQKLLDFVSNEIAYQDHGKYEIFMKPHEVLLSGRSDCSGKVVLYASLLEQVNIPYILVYLIDHICVAIPGDFPAQNEMNFEHKGETYFIAETTVKNFKIGTTYLQEAITEDRFVFMQQPGYQTKLYNVTSGDSLDFILIEIPEQ